MLKNITMADRHTEYKCHKLDSKYLTSTVLFVDTAHYVINAKYQY